MFGCCHLAVAVVISRWLLSAGGGCCRRVVAVVGGWWLLSAGGEVLALGVLVSVLIAMMVGSKARAILLNNALVFMVIHLSRVRGCEKQLAMAARVISRSRCFVGHEYLENLNPLFQANELQFADKTEIPPTTPITESHHDLQSY